MIDVAMMMGLHAVRAGAGRRGPQARALALGLLVPALVAGAAQAQDAASRYTTRWVFEHNAQGWQLQADSATHAQAAWQAGALRLHAAQYQDSKGELHCPVAAVSHGFGDRMTREGRDAALEIGLQVRRWDLGLGLMDDHAPVLEVVHHGSRSQIAVQGFKTMPGSLTLQWARDAGWTIRVGQAAPRPLSVRSAPHTGAPSLRLWIDGCSQGMRQTLELTELRVSAR